ncbi:MAG: hypothetical protein ABIJ09_20780 [Pseudomonadota bacterium]
MRRRPVLLALGVALSMLSADLALAKRAPKAEDEELETSEESAPKAKSRKSGGAALSSTPWGKTFGVGLQLGAPSAITAKLKLENNTAVIFGVGGGWSWGLGSGLEVSVGYVVHPSLLGSYEALNLSWYVGGALDVVVLTHQYYNRGIVIPVYTYSGSPLGLGGHVPIGLDFQFRALPLSLYLEATPGLDLFPVVGPRLGLALGARFFF